MFINELAEPTLLVIYPGRFQPFHKGHHAVYNWLTGKFGRNNVYIATSNKTDNLKSPFTFAEKAYFMQLTGVPADRIVQATQPYQIQNVLQAGAVEFSNKRQTYCDCITSNGSPIPQTTNPYILGTKGNWRPLKSFTHLTDNPYDFNFMFRLIPSEL